MSDQLKKTADDRDAGAFRSLFMTFWPKVRTMLMRQGADRQTAEAIAQETMLAVWRKSNQFSNDKGNGSALIYAIARNLCIGRVRRQAVWQLYSEEFEQMERLQTPANGPLPWEQRRGDIERVLGGLPPEVSQVVQLAFVDGLSQGDIAARLDLPLDVVKSRMRVAFQRLRRAAERAP